MSFNWGGVAAAIQGADAAQRQRKDDERRDAAEARATRADERADQAAAFEEEARGRQRTEWKETDRIKDADKADRDAVAKEFDAKAAALQTGAGAQDVADAQQQVAADKQQAAIDAALAPPSDLLPGAAAAAPAPAASVVKTGASTKPSWATPAPAAADTSGSPKLDPAVAAKLQANAGGIPQAQDFNDSLDRQLAFLRRKSARGDMKPEEYAASATVLDRLKNEGVNDALALMAQGRYDEAMKRYNSVGTMRGAAIIKAEEGTTKINGEDVPTRFVTVRNPDGSRTTMDVAKAQYQLLDMNTQLQHADRANTRRDANTHADRTYELQKKEADQRAKDAAASRSLQARQIAIAEANTPSGQLLAAEKALGRKLTPEEKATKLGFDTLPPQTRAQLNSLLKEVEGISSAMNKSQAEGTWDEKTAGAQQLMQRQGVLNVQIKQLLNKQGNGSGKADADPLGLLSPPPAQKGGAPAAAAAPASPAATPKSTTRAEVAQGIAAQAKNPALGGLPPLSFAAAKASPIPAAASGVLKPVGGVRPQAQAAGPQATPGSQAAIAQAIGLTNDGAMNGVVMQQADAIAQANNAFILARRTYQAVANSGDEAATKQALKDYYTTNDALREALGRVGNQRAAVEAAIGM